jgi:hypothetical protein
VSGPFGFCDAPGPCPEVLVGDKVGVGGGDSVKKLSSDTELERERGWGAWVLERVRLISRAHVPSPRLLSDLAFRLLAASALCAASSFCRSRRSFSR